MNYRPIQRLVTRSFDVFFNLRLNKRLSKQWWGWRFETPSRPLWRHCNGWAFWVVGWCGRTGRGVSNHTHKHIMRPGVMKLLYFNSNVTELCSQLTKEQHPTLVQIMAWCRTGDKPLSQPMMVHLTDRYAPIGLRGVNLRAKTCDPIYVYAVHYNDWLHNETDGVSNHHWLQCLLNSWFRRRSKKTSKICVTGFCVGNSPARTSSLLLWVLNSFSYPQIHWGNKYHKYSVLKKK